jgi:hypothetical protein
MKAVLGWMGLAAVLCVAPLAGAADANGKWKGSFDLNGTSVPTAMNLKVDGTTVTGTVESQVVAAAEIHEGKVDGDNISFWISVDYQGTPYKVVYKGKVASDHIDFSMGTEDGSWGTDLTVKKDEAAVPATPAGAASPTTPDGTGAPAPPATPAPPAVAASPAAMDVTGAWKGAFDRNGTSMPIVLNLKSAGGAVTGTAEGLGPATVEIHDGKVDGNLVTFWVSTDYQGQTYQLNFKGPATGGQIDFSFGTSGGEWGTTVTVKK